MLWLTWRQHRVQLLLTAALLLVLGVGLFLNGVGASHASSGQFSSYCTPGAQGCERVDEGVQDWYDAAYPYVGTLPVFSVLLGIFWGAPLLSREFERGTFRLVWTQSISRGRWLAGKLGLLSAVAALSGLAFGLMVQAWLRHFPGLADTFHEVAFFSMGKVAAVAWWLFAFMLGVAVGAVLKKTIPAIAVTVVLFFSMFIALVLLRPHYTEPVYQELKGSDPALVNALVLDSGRIGPDGSKLPLTFFPDSCPPGSAGNACMAEHGFRNFVEYQPADRYWRFQWTEAGILLAATLLLTAGTVAAVRRRL